MVQSGAVMLMWLWIGMKNKISPKELAYEFRVTTRTVRRWAKMYDWPVVKINARVIFYPIQIVERTFGIKI